MITAVIPTRAGSERVKNKNTKSFADTNLLQIKIDTMKKLKSMGFIEDILVNTNCVESKNCFVNFLKIQKLKGSYRLM